MANLEDFKDAVSKEAELLPRREAWEKKICCKCHKSVVGYPADLFYSDAGKREYHISAMCEICFDSLFGEEE